MKISQPSTTLPTNEKQAMATLSKEDVQTIDPQNVVIAEPVASNKNQDTNIKNTNLKNA